MTTPDLGIDRDPDLGDTAAKPRMTAALNELFSEPQLCRAAEGRDCSLISHTLLSRFALMEMSSLANSSAKDSWLPSGQSLSSKSASSSAFASTLALASALVFASSSASASSTIAFPRALEHQFRIQ